MKYIMTLDQGTTGIKVCLYDKQGQAVAKSTKNIEQIFPKPGWVEHCPKQLWESTLPLADQTLAQAKTSWNEIAAIGITNQRETTILWDEKTGIPLYNAIVWQCRRTAFLCEQLKNAGHEARIREKTGLVLDPYFSATKIRWILDHAKNIPTTTKFGTVDSWIIWNLSGKTTHVTDPTNASRTLLFNIHSKQWDDELLNLFKIGKEILPKVKTCRFAMTDSHLTGGVSIPIAGVAGDQQSALFGQKCWKTGEAKSTYGTGIFIVMNEGKQLSDTPKGLLATLAYNGQREMCYATEGSIFMAGATLEWLKNKLQIIKSPQEADQLASSIPDNGGVYLIPAMAGLGAPQWNPEARGIISGLTQGSGRAQIARAALEAMAYQTRDVFEEMSRPVSKLKVDGGVTKSNFLMQFLADQLSISVIRSKDTDLTSRGAGYLAGLNVGFWESCEEILSLNEESEEVTPSLQNGEENYRLWKRAFSAIDG
ncbi:glycerol kinase GlpK [Waddlia chondrophila]|nr:glycerol kinase GlpK [Waddlia chondrophila]